MDLFFRVARRHRRTVTALSCGWLFWLADPPTAWAVLNAPPVITQQPIGGLARVGEDFRFSIGLFDATAATYQWRLHGSSLAGETNAMLTVTNLAFAEEGNYSVVVTNAGGWAMSTNALLEVLQPISGVAGVGEGFLFSIGPSNATAVAYQWRLDGLSLPGATNATLRLASLSLGAEGQYSVVVTNARGLSVSRSAFLEVLEVVPRELGTGRILQVGAQAGVPITLRANGLETGLFFSMHYNTNTYAKPTFHAANSNAAVTVSLTATGHVGVAMTLPAGQTFPAGHSWVGLMQFDLLSVNGDAALQGGLAYTHSPEAISAVHALIGPSTFLLGDLVDLPSFASKLKQPGRPVDTWLTNQLSDETKLDLMAYQGGDSNRLALQSDLVLDLNRLLNGTSNYNAQRFAGVGLRPETQDLISQNPQGNGLRRLNRLLLEDAYPLDLLRNRSSRSVPLFASIEPQYVVGTSNAPLKDQSGLFEQQLEISNPGATVMSDLNILALNLGMDSRSNTITFFNAHATEGIRVRQSVAGVECDCGLYLDTPPGASCSFANYLACGGGGWNLDFTGSFGFFRLAQINDLLPGESRRVTLEFLVGDHLTVPRPNYVLFLSGPVVKALPANTTPVAITRKSYINSTFVLEFPTQRDKSYYVQYSGTADGLATNAQTVLPAVRGTGNGVQWTDNGPPKTVTPPVTPMRFYRVLQSE